MSPDGSDMSFSKSGLALADAFDEVADRLAEDPGFADDKPAILEHLGISGLPASLAAKLPPLDPDELRSAARAIRAEAIPAFWPWVWWIPWIAYAPEGGTAA